MTSLRSALLAAGLVVVAGAMAAQQQELQAPRGAGSADADVVGRPVVGRIVDEAGLPVAGALVSIRPAGQGREWRRLPKTSAKGRFAMRLNAVGTWEIRVEVAGYRPVEGWFDSRRATAEPFDIGLEIDTEPVVRGWLESAKRQVELGETTRARELYEQAMTVVSYLEHAPILSAVARTYFVEGKAVEAEQSLRQALLLDPQDRDARELFETLLQKQDRGGEVAAALAALDAGDRSALQEEVPSHPVRSLTERPEGRFRASLTSASPWSRLDLLADRFGGYQALGVARGSAWDPAAGSFEVYVPELPDGDRYGVVVWVSPGPSGHVPDRDIIPILDRRGLIWIGANDSGNPRVRADRVRLALDAVAALEASYPLERARIWAAGYSGGGRVASSLVLEFPEVFSGGIFYMGTSFYRTIAMPQKPGVGWPAVLPPPAPSTFDALRNTSRLVLVTGQYDFNRFSTRAYYRELERDGFARLRYLELPGVGHYYGMPADAFAQAIAEFEDWHGPSSRGPRGIE